MLRFSAALILASALHAAGPQPYRLIVLAPCKFDGSVGPKASVTIPSGADGAEIHVIHDDSATAELYDYRRVVIAVNGSAWEGGAKRPSAGAAPNDARVSEP